MPVVIYAKNVALVQWGAIIQAGVFSGSFWLDRPGSQSGSAAFGASSLHLRSTQERLAKGEMALGCSWMFRATLSVIIPR